MPHEDEEISTALAEVLRAPRAGDEKVIVAQIDGQARRFKAEVILFAGGRVSRVDELGIAQAGVELERSVIKVDEQLQTTTPNIWSIGDANGGAIFTHRATYDGPIASLNSDFEIAPLKYHPHAGPVWYTATSLGLSG